jgi:hypothetical protein
MHSDKNKSERRRTQVGITFKINISKLLKNTKKNIILIYFFKKYI